MSHKRCFVYLCYDFPIIGILCFTSVVLYICVLLSLLLVFYFPHKSCFVYLCYDFPIIGILCITSVVLYICVMISLLLVFYVSQALFCISVLWFPYNLYFVFYKSCFVYLCFPYNWYFMYHKRCFVYLCYDFPIIVILCITRVVLYICVLLSL